MHVNVLLVFGRRLMDVYLQQNISPEIEMLANSLAKVVIVNMLNGIPTEQNKVLSFCVGRSCAFACYKQ